MSVLKMTDLDLAGKRVLIREDLNVPIKDGKVASDKRIRASLPTIQHAMNAGAKVMLMSHLGRPQKKKLEETHQIYQTQPCLNKQRKNTNNRKKTW